MYAYFLSCLGEDSYFPPDAPKISDNRLFGMYHAHNKEVILNSMQKEDGVVRVVFATVALGMGVNLVGINRVVHYGAPASIDDYFQESGRAGRSGEVAKSTVTSYTGTYPGVGACLEHYGSPIQNMKRFQDLQQLTGSY